ncbi:hypothetical protein [Actinoplanes sp. NPDC049265]|uniref:hypothetical protein n=1 Tax=Actinoplanes sp. NPDC049265 TaxID=3363902 RepID=UPI003716BF69
MKRWVLRNPVWSSVVIGIVAVLLGALALVRDVFDITLGSSNPDVVAETPSVSPSVSNSQTAPTTGVVMPPDTSVCALGRPTDPGAPAMPQGVRLDSDSDRAFALVWTRSAGATKYRVCFAGPRAAGTNTLDSLSTSYRKDKPDLAPGAYLYWVKAQHGEKVSASSAQITVVIK